MRVAAARQTEDDPAGACPSPAAIVPPAPPLLPLPFPLPVVELVCHAPHPDPRRAALRQRCGASLLGGNAIRGYVRCVLVSSSRPTMQPVTASDDPRYIVAPCPKNSCGHWNVFELVDRPALAEAS